MPAIKKPAYAGFFMESSSHYQGKPLSGIEDVM
ncbi:hypothetical protein CJA_1425 [Cellvibrio japonicus Ueda107]|uniref:Uncharacterized protein n=1 Tax=Cellvibrio japonicus (strain Ueda107) TaxID=498211 RepID=B3PDG7_CELJU|nr:hypothetical protein CJA_1425 [Cellvibrio japonicus Ueda107]